MGRLLALAAVFAAFAAPAAAAPWVGVFQLSVSGGSVDDSWSVHHADAGACDVSQSGSGSETGSLTPGAPVVVTLTGVGTTAFLAPVAGLTTVAQLDRQGSIEYGPDDGDDGDGCPSGDGEAPPAPDCGPSTLPLSLALLPGASSGLIATTADAGSRYDNCPVMGQVLPAIPRMLAAPILVNGIGPAPGPGLALAALAGTDVDADADSDVTSKLEVDLRLDRVAVIEALDLKDAYREAPVDSHGVVHLPVTCPAGKACAGTIAVGISDLGSSAERAVTAPRWPKPLLQAGPALGSARFAIRAGKKARVAVRLAHGSAATLSGLTGEPLDVIVRQSAGKRRKPIAFVVGQVRLRVR